MPDGRERVLFLCTGNSARSQLAEALLRHHAGDRFDAHSAGADPIGVRPETVAVLDERSIDTSGLRSKPIDEYLGKVHFQYLITVCAVTEEHCPRIWPGASNHLHWPVEDPALVVGDGRLEAFRAARDDIEGRILEWLSGVV
ncbi:MAG: arsenate reductase ArsC [Anaerosomatales bacterium]|nr:arsenate reductase ArsC [Anaerosomatales bacterium]MDT8433920.1 arsenate reductase ArsC [Anaerosomatales bacterium]